MGIALNTTNNNQKSNREHSKGVNEWFKIIFVNYNHFSYPKIL